MSRIRSTAFWNGRQKPLSGEAEIDWAHPLASNLVGCFLFNENGGTPVDLVHQLRGSSTALKWATTVLGPVGSFNGTAGRIDATIPEYTSNTTPYSFVSRVRADTTSGVRNIMSVGAGLSGYSFQLRQDSGDWNYYHAHGAGDANARDTGGVTANVDATLGITWDAANMQLYRDTVLKATTAITTNIRRGVNVGLGDDANEPGSPTQYWSGFIYYAYFWNNRVLGTADLTQLYADPYSFLRPMARRRYFFSPTISTILETWNHADSAGALDADQSWTILQGTQWGIASNVARNTGDNSGTIQLARCDTSIGATDHEVNATLATLTYVAGFAYSVGIFCRKDNTTEQTYYDLVADAQGGQYLVRSVVGGVSTLIGTGAVVPSLGDHLRLRAQGTRIRAWIDNSVIVDVTDSSITTGTFGGIKSYLHGETGDVAALDDWGLTSVLTEFSLTAFKRLHDRLIGRGINRWVYR